MFCVAGKAAKSARRLSFVLVASCGVAFAASPSRAQTAPAPPPATTYLDEIYAQARTLLQGPARDHARAAALLQDAAKVGDGRSMVALADLFLRGDGVTKDIDRARTFLQTAINFGAERAAWAALAAFYAPDGPRPDAGLRKDALTHAADAGDPGSMLTLAKLLSADDAAGNFDQIRSLLEQASAEVGSDQAEAWERLGDLFVGASGDRRNLPKAVSAYEHAIELGRVVPMVRLARLLVAGEGGIAVDTDRARTLLEAAVSKPAGDIVEAWVALGDIYNDAAAAARQPAKAVAAYQRAADLGDLASLLKLAKIVGRGEGVPIEFDRAVAALTTVASKDGQSSEALMVLGDLYRDAKPPHQNAAKAVETYQRAADRGDQQALISLARIVGSGSGVPVNLERAIATLQRAVAMGGDGVAAAWSTEARLYRDAAPPQRDLAKAAAAYARAADLGDPWSMISLADMTASGEGVPADFAGAKTLLERAIALGGDSTAWGWAVLGRVYRDAGPPVGNRALAVDAFQHAVDSGDLWSALNLAKILARGDGIPADFGRAVAVLQAPIAAGGDTARYAWTLLAELYGDPKLPQHDPAREADAYQQAADLGDAASMVALAQILTKGGAIPADYGRAFALLNQAISAGGDSTGAAWATLGNLYLETGPQKDVAKAVAAYQKAVDAGDQWSTITLARIVGKGDGIPFDFPRAKLLLEKAIGYGGDLATSGWSTLAQLYAQPGRPWRDPAKAADAYRKAADLGDPWSMISLAQMFISGEGVTEDASKAAPLLKKAAATGSGEAVTVAWNVLGDMYREASAPKNHAELAVDAYEQAAKLNDARAMVQLGKMLTTGDGIAVDRARAKPLLEAAAKTGGDEAAIAWAMLGDIHRSADAAYYDLPLALSYYKRAADAGIGRAHLAIAELTIGQAKTPEDWAEVVSRFRAAAQSIGSDSVEKAMFSLPPATLYSAVQTMLIDAGFRSDVDGVLGRQTQRSVLQFCNSRKIPACGDGKIVTLKLLNGLLMASR